MIKRIFTLIFILKIGTISAQNNLSIKVVDAETQIPIVSATINQDGKNVIITDSSGIATFVLNQNKKITITAIGYESREMIINNAVAQKVYPIALSQLKKSLEEVTVVSSTRSDQNIEKAPIKIEILDAEEMKEESTVKPATVLGIIGDVSGVQIQQVSAVSGNSNVRIQGLDGRYTQILRDGLPLYEGYSGGFGLMSIPPLDLKQVELIKGSASTLYGAGAIGGLVNLISKKPLRRSRGSIIYLASSLTKLIKSIECC